jgi:hypothetical protein
VPTQPRHSTPKRIYRGELVAATPPSSHRDSVGETIDYGVLFPLPLLLEEISMVLDTSVRSQSYVEDCEVCCYPIEVHYSIEDGEVGDFEAHALE